MKPDTPANIRPVGDIIKKRDCGERMSGLEMNLRGRPTALLDICPFGWKNDEDSTGLLHMQDGNRSRLRQCLIRLRYGGYQEEQ
jgi:hypothetical protein